MRQIESRDNPGVKNIVKLQHDKKHRQAQGLFVGEGEVMLKEALASGIELCCVYTTDSYYPIVEKLMCAEKYLVPETLIQHMSDVKTPQGIIFSGRIPKGVRELQGSSILALENIRDSGNMGTVLRTAEGFGIGQVALLGDCVELFNPKTIRASMGSVFRLRTVYTSCAELMEYGKANALPIYATALTQGAVDIRSVNLKNSIAIIGNEAQGVSEQALAIAEQSVIIPITTAQSFNASVAAAVVMWEMVR